MQATRTRADGSIIVSKQDYRPKMPRIHLPPGTYRVRVYYEGLDTISLDGLDGLDRYQVVL